jgi:hypothetical protein
VSLGAVYIRGVRLGALEMAYTIRGDYELHSVVLGFSVAALTVRMIDEEIQKLNDGREIH